jgi:hypothetical protein
MPGGRPAIPAYSAGCGTAASCFGFFSIAWRAHSAADSATAIMPSHAVRMKKSWKPWLSMNSPMAPRPSDPISIVSDASSETARKIFHRNGDGEASQRLVHRHGAQHAIETGEGQERVHPRAAHGEVSEQEIGDRAEEGADDQTWQAADEQQQSAARRRSRDSHQHAHCLGRDADIGVGVAERAEAGVRPCHLHHGRIAEIEGEGEAAPDEIHKAVRQHQQQDQHHRPFQPLDQVHQRIDHGVEQRAGGLVDPAALRCDIRRRVL